MHVLYSHICNTQAKPDLDLRVHINCTLARMHNCVHTYTFTRTRHAALCHVGRGKYHCTITARARLRRPQHDADEAKQARTNLESCSFVLG